MVVLLLAAGVAVFTYPWSARDGRRQDRDAAANQLAQRSARGAPAEVGAAHARFPADTKSAQRQPLMAPTAPDLAHVRHEQAPASVASQSTREDDVDEWEQRFAHEANDAQWAAVVSQALHTSARSAPPASQISHDLVDCKQTVCKLVFGFPDADAIDTHLDTLLTNLKGKSAVSIHLDPRYAEGANTVVKVYLARTTTAH